MKSCSKLLIQTEIYNKREHNNNIDKNGRSWYSLTLRLSLPHRPSLTIQSLYAPIYIFDREFSDKYFSFSPFLVVAQF